MRRKNILLSLTIMTAAAVAISTVAFYLNKGSLVNRFDGDLLANEAFNVDQSNATEESEGVYNALASDAKGNTVNTKFSGFAYEDDVFKISPQSNMYFTNTEPIRGIEDITFTIDIADDYYPDFGYIVYGSSRPLNFDDIFHGYYAGDLVFYFNHFAESHITSFSYANYVDNNYAPSLEDCHYMMVVIDNPTEDTIALSSISFSSVCGIEPETKPISQATDYAERAQMTTYGVPTYFPYLYTNGYEIASNEMFYTVTTYIPMTAANYFFQAAISNGYENITGDEIPSNVILFQKKVSSSECLSMYLMFDPFHGSSFIYGQFVYSNAMPYMGGEAYDVWPTEAIVEASTEALANAFPAPTITNTKYKITAIYNEDTMIDVILTLTCESLEDALEDIDTYLEGLDPDQYVVGAEYGAKTVETKDAKFFMRISLSGYDCYIELRQYKVFNSFPVDILNVGDFIVPDSIAVDGEYLLNGAFLRATFNGSDTIEDLIAAFVDRGYEHIGSNESGSLLPYLMVTESYGLTTVRYQKIGANTYSIHFDVAQHEDTKNLKEALTHIYDSYEEAFEPINYEDGQTSYYRFNLTSGFTFAFIEADDTILYSIFNSINVSNKVLDFDGRVISYIQELDENHYYQVHLLFKFGGDGAYIFVDVSEQNEDELNQLLNPIDAVNRTAYGEHFIDLPNGRRYQAVSGNSVRYISDMKDVREKHDAYEATLLSNGYTLTNSYSGKYKAPEGELDICMQIINRQGISYLYIYIDTIPDFGSYMNYTDTFVNAAQSAKYLEQLGRFPDVLDKDDDKKIYTNVFYSEEKDSTLFFIVDASEFSAYQIANALVGTYGFSHRYGESLNWMMSLTFEKSDATGTYVFSITPQSTPASGEVGMAYSVYLQFIPAE